MWRRALMSQRIPGCRDRGDIYAQGPALALSTQVLFSPDNYCSPESLLRMKSLCPELSLLRDYSCATSVTDAYSTRSWRFFQGQPLCSPLHTHHHHHQIPTKITSLLGKTKKTTKHIFCFSRNGLQCYKKCCIKSLVHLILFFSLLQYIVCSSG